jgi:predicted CopG family antitoxin
VLQALDILVKQGKAGAFTLKDLSTQGNRVTAAYGAMGRSGIDAVREMGAVLQVFRKSSGSAEEASTAFKNFFSDLMEPSKQKNLQKLGVNIWDPAKLKEGKKQIRSAVDIIDELFNKLKGDPEKLARIFGMQSMDGLKAFIAEWQKSGKNAASEFMKVSGDGAELSRDSARAAQEFNASLKNLYTSWQRFSQNNLTAPIQKMANYLNSLDPKAVDLWLKVMTYSAGALGGAVLAKKGWDVLSWGRDILKGKGGKPGKGGLPGLPGSGNAVPVYVVNMPGSIPGLSTPSVPGGPAGKAGKFGRVLKAIPLAALGEAAFVGGMVYTIGSLATELKRKLNKWATGGKYDSLDAVLKDIKQRQKTESQKKAEVGGKIKIEIQQNGQARVSQLHSVNPSVKFDVSTGLMMAGGY